MKTSKILYNIYSLLILLDLINEFNVYKGVLWIYSSPSIKN
jgi:hypothetical protein